MSEKAMEASADVAKLYRQTEGKLEAIVEKLLVSKINESENILDSMQRMMEKIFIDSAMRIANQNVSQAARLLGMNRNTLAKKLKEIGGGKT
jgi:DNA-binding protein Fis